MANRVRGVNRPHLEIGATTDQEKDAARLREAAKMRFEYLWSTLYTSVESIKRLSVLTLLTTLFLISYGAVPTFEANFSNKQATGSFALYQTVAALLNRFAFGIMLTAIFYLLYSLFMTALMKRRATWNSLSG
jgi:ABC-type molybdate transport system permease subunit